jgi:hypothetical protein
MIIKISKTEDLNNQLQKEGKITLLNGTAHTKAMEEMNRDLEENRREYQVKDRESQMSAAKVILTA